LAALASSGVRGRLRRLKLLSTTMSLAIVGALLVVAPDLRAQEATRSPLSSSPTAQGKEAPPVGAVRVVVATAEDDLLLSAAHFGERQAIVSCYRRCAFWAEPGNYTLLATSPERDVYYLKTLHVNESSAFQVSSGHPLRRTVGLIAGIVGPIVMVSGVVLFLNQLTSDPAYQCNEANCPPAKSHPVGPAL
jgi:hypothetical protein